MIRTAGIKDLSRIAEIIVFGKRVAYRDIFKNDYFSFNELQVMDLIETYRDKPELIKHMLVYDDGIVKGVINREYHNNVVEISEFYVEPMFKRQGIGRKLLQYVFEEERKMKRDKINLWVVEENHPARRFYEVNGMKASGITCLIEGTDKTDMCYEMKL